MTVSSDTYPAGGIVPNLAGHSARKKVTIAISTLLLSTAFTFAAAPAATAATAENSGIATFWQPDECRGNTPGVCPYGYPVDQQGNQQTMLPDQPITTHQSRTPQSHSPQSNSPQSNSPQSHSSQSHSPQQ